MLFAFVDVVVACVALHITIAFSLLFLQLLDAATTTMATPKTKQKKKEGNRKKKKRNSMTCTRYIYIHSLSVCVCVSEHIQSYLLDTNLHTDTITQV